VRLSKIPKFLMVQYAPGSAGKFLASLLMCSPSLSHFDPTVEISKTEEQCIAYIQNHFPSDITQWVLTEPNHASAWNLHFISGKYPRGDDLTTDQFISQATVSATDHFCHSVNQDKIIPSIWHKSNIPLFLENSRFVTIIIDPPAIKWYHRASWYKSYGWKDGNIHLKMNDPSMNPAMALYFQKFNNPVTTNENFFSFVKREILDNPFKKQFLSSTNFNQPSLRSFVNLSDLLNFNLCVNAVNRICKELDIVPIPLSIITQGHKHWLSCHTFKYAT
jgi:hypothetical protein